MSKQVDANEINKVMVERANLNRQLLQSKTQLNHQTTLKRKSELTQQELAELSDDTVVYRAIGMYNATVLHLPRDRMFTHLTLICSFPCRTHVPS